jgi:hypothetical protein
MLEHHHALTINVVGHHHTLTTNVVEHHHALTINVVGHHHALTTNVLEHHNALTINVLGHHHALTINVVGHHHALTINVVGHHHALTINEFQSAAPHLATAQEGRFLGKRGQQPVRRDANKEGSRSLSPAMAAWNLELHTCTFSLIVGNHSSEGLCSYKVFLVLWCRFTFCRFGRAFPSLCLGKW